MTRRTRLFLLFAAVVVVTAVASLRSRPDDAAVGLTEVQRREVKTMAGVLKEAPSGSLFAGFGEVELVGSSGDSRPAEPSAPPRLKVLLLGLDRAPRLALVTLDSVAIGDRITAVVAAFVGEATKLPADRVVVIASHAHAGTRLPQAPIVNLAFGRRELDEADLARAARAAADQASDQFGAARIGFAQVDFPRYVAQRTPGAGSGVDTLLRSALIDSDGRRLLLWSYAAHPTLAGRNGARRDADYPGRVATGLQRDHHADMAMFLPGQTAQAGAASTRNPADFAAALGAALAGLRVLAEGETHSRCALAMTALTTAEPAALPLFGGLTLAPSIGRHLGPTDQRIVAINLCGQRLIALSGEPAQGLFGARQPGEWLLGMAGMGYGYLVPPKERFLGVEAPFVVLSDGALKRTKQRIQALFDQ